MKLLFPLLVMAGLLWGFALPDAPKSAAELGEKLFSDPILSLDKSQSCATCHIPAFAFADTAALSLGVAGKRGTRNTPSVMNMLSRPYFFYDGRAGTLEDQALHPIRNPVEMNLQVAQAVERLRKHKHYPQWFKNIYGKAPDSLLLGDAIAQFIRTLESPGDSPMDRWQNQAPGVTMTPEQIRGREIFMVKGKCFECHFSPDLTGDEFRNIGLYNGKNLNDLGRFDFTKDSADIGKFKVPGLRNVAMTAPYMHNGMFRTLEEVIDYYDQPDNFVSNAIGRDSLLSKPLNLTAQEKKDLLQFMHALTDKRFQKQSK